MADPQLNEVNVLSQKYIVPNLSDNYFKNSPTLAYIKRNRFEVWKGGEQVQLGYGYKPKKGRAYSKGETFDTTALQTKSGLLFNIKTYEVNDTQFLEDLAIFIKGPQAVMSKVDTDLGTCSLTMSAMLAIALYRHGQNLGGANDRSKEMNGLEEALADGTNNTFSGVSPFPTYGGETRATVSPALNSPTGLIAANVNGPITYRVLEHSYQSCVIGDEHPVMGVTTNRCMGYINENFQPQQRIDTKEPVIGYTGIKFKDATIVQDQYCPGADGVNDANLGNYNAANETFWWLNPGGEGDDSHFKLWFGQDPLFQFGFTGYKVAQNSTMVAGQILAAVTFTVRNPRYMRALFGING